MGVPVQEGLKIPQGKHQDSNMHVGEARKWSTERKVNNGGKRRRIWKSAQITEPGADNRCVKAHTPQQSSSERNRVSPRLLSACSTWISHGRVGG